MQTPMNTFRKKCHGLAWFLESHFYFPDTRAKCDRFAGGGLDTLATQLLS